MRMGIKARSTALMLAVLLIIITAAGCGGGTGQDESASAAKYGQVEDSEGVMKIHFIDVGQGDCTFVDMGDKEALVDCGEWEYSEDVIDYISQYVDGSLDLVIATHPDSDHIGGMMYIFEHFQVDMLIDSGAVKDTVTYFNYADAANSEPDCERIGDDDMYLEWSEDAGIRIIETGDEDEDPNELSVIAQVEYGDVKVLLTGDMGRSTERNNLYKFDKVQVLKAGHHGSSKSTCEEFLDVTRPDFVIISAGAGNSYGHPHVETMDRLDDIGATVYQTMNSGTIVMKTDGSTYSFDNSGSITVTEPSDDPTYSVGSSGETDQDTSDIRYAGNKNSKKFHYIYCGSVESMSEKNKVYFESREEAVSSGYEPCGSCQP